jgi:hypothetical protein
MIQGRWANNPTISSQDDLDPMSKNNWTRSVKIDVLSFDTGERIGSERTKVRKVSQRLLGVYRALNFHDRDFHRLQIDLILDHIML